MPNDDDQGVLIDTSHPAHKPILKLARAIRSKDAERTEIQDAADALRDKLKDVMREHKLTHFVHGDIEVRIKESEEKVSVKTRKREGDGPSEDPGEE